MKLLNLNAYQALGLDENEEKINILLSRKEIKGECPNCHSANHDKYGHKLATYADLPIRAKRVSLTIKLQRYKCKDCKKLYQDEVSDMSQEYRMTKRLEEYVLKQASRTTFTRLADEIGVSEGLIRRMFAKRKRLSSNVETPTVLGIDEIYIAGKPRCVLTDISNRKVFDMLKDRNKTTIAAYLQKLEDNDHIKYVTMDMWRPYKDVVKGYLPNAQIVVDKFHVVRMSNNSVELCRKEIRKTLTAKQRLNLKGDRFTLLKRERNLSFEEQMTLSYWSQNYPTLYKVHALKEEFYGIYEAKSKVEAYNRYAKWENKLESDVLPYFSDLHRAVSNWHNEIFAYFDYPATNAYTESLNSVIRHIDRMGRGHGFEVIRGKVMSG